MSIIHYIYCLLHASPTGYKFLVCLFHRCSFQMPETNLFNEWTNEWMGSYTFLYLFYFLPFLFAKQPIYWFCFWVFFSCQALLRTARSWQLTQTFDCIQALSLELWLSRYVIEDDCFAWSTDVSSLPASDIYSLFSILLGSGKVNNFKFSYEKMLSFSCIWWCLHSPRPPRGK